MEDPTQPNPNWKPAPYEITMGTQKPPLWEFTSHTFQLGDDGLWRDVETGEVQKDYKPPTKKHWVKITPWPASLND